MALQEKAIACGVSLTILGMVLRFIVGPATALIGALAMGLRGDVLRFAIIQVNALNLVQSDIQKTWYKSM